MALVTPEGGPRPRLPFPARLRIGFWVAAVLLLGLLLRAYYLQIIRGDHYRELSEHNRLALIKHRAPRGIIFDRHRRALVSNQPTFTALLVPEDTRDIPGTTAMLVRSLGVDSRWLDETLRQVGRYRRFAPIDVKENLSAIEMAYLEEMRYQYPGRADQRRLGPPLPFRPDGRPRRGLRRRGHPRRPQAARQDSAGGRLAHRQDRSRAPS